MYQELLQQIEKEAATFGETLEKPITSQQLEAFKREAQEKLSYALPQDYVEFLELHDGLMWNGLEIFGSETKFNAETKDATLSGLVYENAGYRMDDDVWQDYIVFGDADISWFVYSIKDKRYEVRDRGSFSFVESFNSFEEMMTEALQVAA